MGQFSIKMFSHLMCQIMFILAFFLGEIKASDADKGPDGYLTFSISPPNTYFDIDHRTGALTIRKQLDTGVLRSVIQGSNSLKRRRKRRSLTEVQFNVIAKSHKSDSLSST